MITVAELRAALDTPPEEEGKLLSLRDFLVADFESRTKKIWNSVTGSSRLIIRRQVLESSLPIILYAMNVSNLVLTSWSKSETEADAEILDATDFYSYQKNQAAFIIERVSGSWEWFTKATFDAGYTSVPNRDIKEALFLQARFWIQRHTDDKIIVSSQGVEGGSATYFMKADMHPVYQAAIKRYIRK